MALFQNCIMRSLVIQLVCWFGWFSCFVLAQFDISEGVTGSVNFPALGITCVGNLAVFAASLIRGRLDLEMSARDVLDILNSPKLNNINGIEDGCAMTTCGEGDLDSASVVVLSNGSPNWSMRQFMKSNAPIAHSIVLQFFHLGHEAVTVGMCEGSEHECNCIVFWTVEKIRIMLTRQMPGALKQLPNSRCLILCLTCFINGCHGQMEDSADERYRLTESDSKVVSRILDKMGARSTSAGELICICIPMNDAPGDDWTKLLIKSFRSKDAEGRGVTVKASEVLEGYLVGGRGGEEGIVQYSIFSFIVPRLTEVIINLVLTFWFRVDGFSSAIVARRTVRDYLVDTKGSGLAANAFLTEAMVKCDQDNTHVCQVLRFRGNIVCIITYFTGCVNLVASLCWALLISFEGEGEGGADTSPLPSMAILVVIIAAIATAFGMDLAPVLVALWEGWKDLSEEGKFYGIIVIIATMTSPVSLPVCLILKWLHVVDGNGFIIMTAGAALEMVCIVAGSAVAGTMGIKSFGRWLYAALQLLVWVKWAVGSYFLHDENTIEFYGANPDRLIISIYSSAFMLNAVLAGVRCKWEAWPWKNNHLFSFSRKVGR